MSTTARMTARSTVNQISFPLKKAADVNADDRMDISDATAILTYYARNAAGLNPSWDEIFS